MKFAAVSIYFSLLFTLCTYGNNYPSIYPAARPDTITPPPPPGGPLTLTGPTSACVGDMSEYSTEVPVSCFCQWYVEEVLQAETSPVFTYTWTQAGVQEVAVAFLCEGILSDPETLPVTISGTPQPTPIQGETVVCEYTYHTYSTTVGPGDSCQWTVNGAIQPGFGPSINYTFGDSGPYLFEVIAFNPCGTSGPQTLEVTAQGNAPGTPSPIQGPDESCEGNTDSYTTTVGQGESCEWRIDGVLQTTGSASLDVTWDADGSHLIEVRAVSDCGTGNPVFKNVAVFTSPYVFLGNDTTIMQYQTLLLDAGNPGSDYLWSTGATTQTITVSITGTYSVNVSNYCGSADDSIEVTVFVGMEEIPVSTDCPGIFVESRVIRFASLPQKTNAIQVFSLSGSKIYNGAACNEIIVPGPGIYLVRIIAADYVCQEKIFMK